MKVVKIFTIVVTLLFFNMCDFRRNEMETEINDTGNIKQDYRAQTKSETTKTNGFTKIHTLIDSSGVVIGNIYAKMIDDSVFSNLYVTIKNDTIYRIIKDNFYNSQGLDIEVYDDKCYEYKIVFLKMDYFMVNAICRSTKTISDGIVIEWDYQRKVLEVHKTP